MRDVYAEITNTIVTGLKTASGDFKLPWHKPGLSLPENATTKCPYHGINGGLGVNLANEMRLSHTRIHGTSRVEIMGETRENISALKQYGCIVEIHNYQTKMFVPNISVIKSILERYPVVY